MKIKKVENKAEKNVLAINLGIIITVDINAANIQRVFHSEKYDDLKKNLNVLLMKMAFFVVGEGLTTHRYHTRRSTRHYYQRNLI